MKAKYVIIGAGPTGLAAAHRLMELGENSFLILERHPHVGGLSASFKDKAGFTWDIGGHVVFSHYEYFDRLLDSLLGADCLEHQRVSRVRCAGTWVPYPFQNNIRHLPKDLVWECVQGLLPENRPTDKPVNFREFFDYVFGDGLTRLFMEPYNFKVWATPAEYMSWKWIGERVSIVDLKRVLENILLEKDDVSWGPNNIFRFPLNGGTGEIFTRLAQRVYDRILLDAPVVSVETKEKIVRTEDGRSIHYTTLLNTGPLDRLVRTVMDTSGHAPFTDAHPDMIRLSRKLKHNSVYVAGVGVDSMKEDDTCWMYFPEDNAPFYRVTNFHNYSPNNTAEPGRQRALMCETSSSKYKPENTATLMDQTVEGLKNVTLLHEDAGGSIVSRWAHHVNYGYPVPTLERDEALNSIQPWLEEMGIFSRGRFGGWKYEVANMDHSVMQGVEWAERMIREEPETTYTIPK